MVLVLLIHCICYMVMNCTDKAASPVRRPEMCRISQSRPIEKTIRHLYSFFSIQAGSLGNVESPSTSTDKNIVPASACFCERNYPQGSPYSASLHTANYRYDPISYYIYRLRKIVV